jgi:hypothetical protein
LLDRKGETARKEVETAPQSETDCSNKKYQQNRRNEERNENEKVDVLIV